MSKEKQIDDFENDLRECHTEFSVSDDSMDLYTDYKITAQNMIGKGWRKQSEWISVEERLPKPYKTVLVFCRNGFNTFQSVSEMLDENGKRWSAVCGIPVTHWMPLPEAPKMRKEDGGK